MNTRKIMGSLAAVSALAILVGFGAASHAFADNGGDSNESSSTGGNSGSGNGIGQVVRTLADAIHQGGDRGEGNANSMSESASVNPAGNFSVTGVTVVSVDAANNAITGTLYGITRTVGVAGATITGAGATIPLSSVQAGDKISAGGTWNESTHAVTVTKINDVSYASRNSSSSDAQARINQLLQLVQQLQEQLKALQSH